MSTFTFQKKNLLNSTLRSDGSSVSYETNTSSGMLGRKKTSLTPTSNVPFRGVHGAIHWRKHKFEIGGVKKKRSSLEHSNGLFSRARVWQWSDQSYTVKYHHNQWIATSTSSQHPSSAVFSLRKFKLFGSSRPASIAFSGNISTEDMIFLTLVMIYSETKRREKKSQAAVDIADSVPSVA